MSIQPTLPNFYLPLPEDPPVNALKHPAFIAEFKAPPAQSDPSTIKKTL